MIESIQEQISHVFQEEPIYYLGSNLYRKDIQTMFAHTELGSEAIHFTMKVIASNYSDQSFKVMDPFITNMLIHMGNDEIILQTMRDQKIFEHQLIFIPSNTQTKMQGKGSHWFLMVYQCKKQKLFILDSSYEVIHKNSQIMKQRLQKMQQLFKGNKSKIQIQRYAKTPKQQNFYDCGIYVAGFMQCILQTMKKNHKQSYFDINDVHMDKQRFTKLRSHYFQLVINNLKHYIKQIKNKTEQQ